MIACGGSIESRRTPDGLKEVVGGIAQLAQLAAVRAACEVRVERFSCVPSYSLRLTELVALAQSVAAASSNGLAPVVTTGTDTMEETAFVLDLFAPQTAVVLTGAAGDSSPASDGPDNLATALVAASSSKLVGGCAYVAFAGCVRLGREVVETHANGDMFAGSGEPVARVFGQALTLTRRAAWLSLPPLNVPDTPAHVLLVEAHVAAPVLPAELADASVVVVRGLGAGNVPTALGQVLEQRLDAGLPVVLCASSYGVRMHGVTRSSGGGGHLLARGALSAESLTARKAALLASLCFGHGVTDGAAQFAEVANAC